MRVKVLEASHSPMLSMPEKLAGVLGEAVEEMVGMDV